MYCLTKLITIYFWGIVAETDLEDRIFYLNDKIWHDIVVCSNSFDMTKLRRHFVIKEWVKIIIFLVLILKHSNHSKKGIIYRYLLYYMVSLFLIILPLSVNVVGYFWCLLHLPVHNNRSIGMRVPWYSIKSLKLFFYYLIFSFFFLVDYFYTFIPFESRFICLLYCQRVYNFVILHLW